MLKNLLQPAQPKPTNWNNLSDAEKLTLISHCDFSTRRALRCCSSKTKELVENFPHREKMKFHCTRHRPEDGRWYCEYNIWNRLHRAKVEFFDTCQAAYQRMEKLIRTVETIGTLNILLESDSICSLCEDNKLVKVVNLSLSFDREFDERPNEPFKRLMKQLDPIKLESVHLNVLLDDQKEAIRDHFLDLERTTFPNLRNFYTNCSLNDQQLLGMRISEISMDGSTAITTAGLVSFVQKMVLQTTPRKKLKLFNISNDMQVYLFGRLFPDEDDDSYRMVFNTVRPDWKVIFVFSSWPFSNDVDTRVTVTIKSIRDDRILIEHGVVKLDNNSEVIGEFPGLSNFLDDVSAGLPSDFLLSFDGAFLRNR